MLKKIILTTLGLLLIVGLLGGIKGMQIATLIAAAGQQVLPAEAVTTATAREEKWESTLNAVGSLTAVQGVTVSAESPGKVVEIGFESGTKVKAGDLLIRQDTTTEAAQLSSAEAGVALAKLNLDRSRDLAGKHTISQSELDAADAQYKQAAALAENIRATIAKKTIRAPFAGRLGIRQVNLGQTLKEGDPVVSLQSLDPIYVNFSLPQQELRDIALGLVVRLTGDALGRNAAEGRITAISPDVDPATRSVRVQATLTNGNDRLHPGMFVETAVILPQTLPVLAIPSTSVLNAPYGDSVFVVEDKKDPTTGETIKIVRQQFVRLGLKRGDFIAVTSGLKAGETIVTTGAFKLRNGGTVRVENSLAPDAQLNPTPSNS